VGMAANKINPKRVILEKTLGGCLGKKKGAGKRNWKEEGRVCKNEDPDVELGDPGSLSSFRCLDFHRRLIILEGTIRSVPTKIRRP